MDAKRIVEGPLARELARFGTPLAIGMVLQTTFNLVDAYLVAQLPRAEVGPAIGALGICDQIAAIGTILSYGVSTATASILSQLRGAGKDADIRRSAWQSILIVLTGSIVFGVVGAAGAGPLVREIIGAKGEVAVVATRYLRVILGGSATIFFLLQLTTIQRALGSSKTPVALLVSGNVLNVLIAILFIYGPGPAPAQFAWAGALARALGIPRMGMVGAAWATLIARGVVLIPIALVLVKRHGLRVPPRGERGPNRAEMGRLLAIAWPTSTQFVLRIFAMLFVNSVVARAFTTESDQTATTALGLVFRLDSMALFVAMGWGSAAQTFVGQNLGAKRVARATRTGWLTVGYDALTNLALIALAFFAGERILSIFDDDARPLALAVVYLRVVAPSYLGLGVGVVLGNAMAGAGATRTTLLVDLAVIMGFQVPVSLVAVLLFDVEVHGLFRCVAATNIASAIAYALVYARGSWRNSAMRPVTGPHPIVAP